MEAMAPLRGSFALLFINERKSGYRRINKRGEEKRRLKERTESEKAIREIETSSYHHPSFPHLGRIEAEVTHIRDLYRMQIIAVASWKFV